MNSFLQAFFTMMYILSSVCIIVIMTWAWTDRLTDNYHYQEQGSELFMRAGATGQSTQSGNSTRKNDK